MKLLFHLDSVELSYHLTYSNISFLPYSGLFGNCIISQLPGYESQGLLHDS